MDKSEKFHPELLRPVEFVNEPDPRSDIYVRIDYETGQTHPIELSDHHGNIAHIKLHGGVPEDVLIQFETARNLYLYAWFIYRFYPVSERHALSTLEYALRSTLGDAYKTDWKEKERTRREKNPETKKKKYKDPTLFPLLEYAIENNVIKNEGYSVWHRNVETRAQERYRMQKLQEMQDKGLKEITYNDKEFEINDEDKNIDYISMLPEFLSLTRNDYSHGSTTLHNLALSTFVIVSETINQLYSIPAPL